MARYSARIPFVYRVLTPMRHDTFDTHYGHRQTSSSACLENNKKRLSVERIIDENHGREPLPNAYSQPVQSRKKEKTVHFSKEKN
jgi:hypothetical protein